MLIVSPMMLNTFGKEIIPDNEQERLAALARYEVLDSPPEGAFDKIASLAQAVFSVPIALIALVDSKRVFFKANVGMEGTTQVHRGISLCSLAILQEEVTVFENASEDPCLLHNPLVAGSFGLRFYAGAPIITHDGYRVGTVCIVDHQPRQFSEGQRDILKQMASLVMNELELRLSARKTLAAHNELLTLTVHDIKNPINNISGLANLIKQEAEDTASVRTYAGLVAKSIHTLNGVVQQLLDSSLNLSGTHVLKLERVDMAELVQQTLEENKASLLKKNQKINFKPIKGLNLQGDSLRLKLAIDNLVSNASKYSPVGSAIDLQLQQIDGALRLKVEDKGQGLTTQDKEQLFGKYNRLSARPTGNESSSGLGLYITKKIVEQHSGKIWAESEGQHKGSRFYIELPRQH